MTLAELQRLFAGVVLDGSDASALHPFVVGDAASTRVEIYTDMYRLRLLEVLESVYARTRALLGDDWDSAATAYIRTRPSRSPSLRGYGRGLDELLPPEPASLAMLEWARYDLFDAVDEPVLVGATLQALAPEQLMALPLVRLAASAVITTPVDADALWCQRGAKGAATLLVWREDVTLFHRRVDAREAGWLARLDGSLTLGMLCSEYAPELDVTETAQLVFALVGRWVADGLLVDSAAVR